MEYLSKHVYRYETQHPPLERVMGALGPYLSGLRTIDKPTATEEAAALLPPVPRTNRTVMLMRLGILPIFVVAVLSLFFGARRWFGTPAAVLATAIFSMIPTVLAHAGLATTDIALTAFLGAAFFSLVAWAESPTVNRALLFRAVDRTLGTLQVHTLLYLPAGAVLAIIFYILARRPGMVELAALGRERLPGFGMAIGAGALVIWAGYLFSFGRVPGWSFNLPAPEFFDGVRAVLKHNEGGHNAYLLGQRSMTGWWYFFPVALSVKTPLPILLLILPGVVACFQQRRRYGLMPVAFALGALLPAMAGQINIGVRHVLPVYLSFSMVAVWE